MHFVVYRTDGDFQARSLNCEDELSFVMSVCLSVCFMRLPAWNNSAPAELISFTVDTRGFFENL